MSGLDLLQKHMERDMEALRTRLRRMADLVIKQLEDAVRAFAEGDTKLAYKVVLNDHQIDVLEQHIDRLCQEFLVRHMPVAEYLRFVVSLAKVNSELERIGDYAEAMARRAVTLSASATVPERERIVEMSRVSFQMLREAVDAFVSGDEVKAMRTLDSDPRVDEMNAELFLSLSQPAHPEKDLTVRFALLGLIQRIERVADRACNVAEEAIYVARGQVLRHLPRHDIRVLFLCSNNSCRSQMAEGIAHAFAPSTFIFSSAGPDPTGVDPGAVEFLATKGIDISRQRSKGLSDVGHLRDFHVVVTLSRQAEEQLPPIPYEAVALNWDVADPLKADATPETTQAAYQQAYDDLTVKITELTEALGGAFDREDD